jgi:hypothetical protein
MTMSGKQMGGKRNKTGEAREKETRRKEKNT